MSRTMTLTLVVFVSSMVASVVYVTTAVGQDDLFFDPGSSVAPKTRVAAPAQSQKSVSDKSVSALRDRYLELTKVRSQLMSEAELKLAIAGTENDNKRLEAQQQLDKASEMLKQIGSKYSGTPAGQKAMAAYAMIAEEFHMDPATVRNSAQQLRSSRTNGLRQSPPRSRESLLDDPVFPANPNSLEDLDSF